MRELDASKTHEEDGGVLTPTRGARVVHQILAVHKDNVGRPKVPRAREWRRRGGKVRKRLADGGPDLVRKQI